MAEELLVVLSRRDPSCGLGFSLLGTPGLPPIIYDIVENSPAAESGKVEAGDVILKVNETDVNRLNTKEVLKCIRLSEDPIALKLKRDPLIKAKVRHYLSTPNPFDDPQAHNNGDSYLPPRHPPTLEDVTRSNGDGSMEKSPQPQPRFEAFVMTGDRVLKLSKTQQGSILPKQRKVDSLSHHNYHNHNNHQRYNSVPTSPIESERHSHQKTSSAGTSPTPSIAVSSAPIPSSSFVVRTSRSEDHLQFNKDSSMSAVSIDIDDDVTSSLNTLLDTRPDSEAEDQRVIWTYNAPMTDSSTPTSATTTSENASPHRSLSPQSPTSVSSSVMSSDSGDRKLPNPNLAPTDLSQSEAISNISSPDFQEEDVEILNARDLVMEISDPSDSDSTLLLSETTAKVRRTSNSHNGHHMNNSVKTTNKNDQNTQGDHRIVIQVKGPEKDLGRSQSPRNHNMRLTNQQPTAERMNTRPCIREAELYQLESMVEHSGYQALKDSDEDKLLQLTESAASLAKAVSPPLEDESDIESLHSFHYSPKAVDIPSAVRLAKRLFTLDGFKKSDVSRHLSKNNDFSKAVAEEYLKYFIFEGDSLDIALHKFLKQFSLAGETQERERVLVHFSKRYLDCNPGSFNSQDAVHTLTCAIMLLNTDLHGQIIGRKMTCTEFIDNLSELNDGENFPREVLKSLYQAIKGFPLEWALDEDGEDTTSVKAGVGERGEMPTSLSVGGSGGVVASGKGFFDVPSSQPAIEYKKGYVMRKSCVEPNGKKTPLGKRGWKMFYCTLRDLVLYLHKDEHGFRKSQLSDNLHNAIRIHHSLATKATDYTKKLHVFRLETADQAEYLFQTSDSKELQSWIDTINFVCASFSAQPLPGAVGSQKKFQPPLLPSSQTKLNLREQLQDHEEMVHRLETELEQHRRHVPERGAKALAVQNYKEKDAYLHHELKRYKTYAYLLKSRISQFPEMEGSLVESSIGEVTDEDENQSPTNNRKHTTPALTVRSLTATAAIGAAWSRSCLTNILRERSQTIAVASREPETMTLYAGLQARQAESKKVIVSLLEIASCPVCFERLRPSSTYCINGHAVCERCKIKTPKCPTCSGKFSEEKHTLLHQILEALPFSCRFRGCMELTQDLDYHEKWCGFKRTKCLVPRCQWSGMVNEIRNHVENMHSLSDTAVDNYHYINRDFTWIYARVQHGQVFWDIRKNDLRAKMFSIQIIWVPNGEVKQDVFQLKVEFQSEATKFVATSRLLSNPNQVLDEGSCLIFHTEMLKPFTEKNDIYYKLYLTKD